MVQKNKTNNNKTAGAFTWHSVSDEEKKEIRKKAKDILEDFSKKLSKLENSKEFKEPLIERSENERKEKDSNEKLTKINRETFFKNAPNFDKKKEKIIAETGHWI